MSGGRQEECDDDHGKPAKINGSESFTPMKSFGSSTGDRLNEKHPRQRILGVDFFHGSTDQAVDLFFEGGLVVAPSAPGMVLLPVDQAYREALCNADLALLDSGYMAILWRLLSGERVTRISGLRFLTALLRDSRFRGASRFWVMPSDEAGAQIRAWLETRGLAAGEPDCYTAPHYRSGAIVDPALLDLLEARRPAHVILNIGGGVQEVLGHWLRENLSYRPGILCTGAAIGFLAGVQTRIPTWVDRCHLGWLWRIRENPHRYGRRYAASRSLWYLVVRWRRELPRSTEVGGDIPRAKS